MLCRVADSLFWMSRYIERAENTVRLLDVNLHLLLEIDGADKNTLENYWQPILESTGDYTLFRKLHSHIDNESVSEFLTFSKDNPGSVVNCVLNARENARMIRDQISSEMWEIINRMYLFIRNQTAAAIWREGPYDFYQHIREYSHLFQGITESTFPHRVGYEFIKSGKFLERADKTGRMLHAKQLMDQRWIMHGTDNVLDIAQWVSVLRACSALEAYHQIYVSNVIPRNVLEFLILSRSFPRSVLFCLSSLQRFMHAISGCPATHFSNEAERLCGRLISELSYTSIEEIMASDLDPFFKNLHENIGQIAIALNNAYMFFPIVDPTRDKQP